MLLDMKADNENDTWQTLSLATRRLLAKIDEKQDEQPDGDSGSSTADEDKRRAEASYIEQRMRDFERFERMVSGYYRPRRKQDH